MSDDADKPDVTVDQLKAGGKGKLTFSPDHKPLMRVPKGGSSCKNCEYVDVENHACKSEHYAQWNGGSSKLPDYDLDEMCSDWYEPGEMLTVGAAKEAGERAALRKFGGWLDVPRQMLIGQAPRAFVEGARAFKPGGALSVGNVLWPKMPGHPVQQALGRAGSLMTLAALPSMMRQDQGEGTGSRLLGGLGGLAGLAYGGTAGGMVGAPIGYALGRGLGHGVGHLLGSRPKEDQQ